MEHSARFHFALTWKGGRSALTIGTQQLGEAEHARSSDTGRVSSFGAPVTRASTRAKVTLAQSDGSSPKTAPTASLGGGVGSRFDKLKALSQPKGSHGVEPAYGWIRGRVLTFDVRRNYLISGSKLRSGNSASAESAIGIGEKREKAALAERREGHGSGNAQGGKVP